MSVFLPVYRRFSSKSLTETQRSGPFGVVAKHVVTLVNLPQLQDAPPLVPVRQYLTILLPESLARLFVNHLVAPC